MQVVVTTNKFCLLSTLRTYFPKTHLQHTTDRNMQQLAVLQDWSPMSIVTQEDSTVKLFASTWVTNEDVVDCI